MNEEETNKYVRELNLIHGKLKEIADHTDATREDVNKIQVHLAGINGSLKEHEKDIEKLEKDFTETKDWAEEIVDNRTTTSCPNLSMIKDANTRVGILEKKLIDVFWLIEHKSVSFIVLAVIIAGMLLSAWSGVEGYLSKKKGKTAIEVQQEILDKIDALTIQINKQ